MPSGASGSNVAVQVNGDARRTVDDEFDPLQSPLQPAKTDPCAGTAVSVTGPVKKIPCALSQFTAHSISVVYGGPLGFSGAPGLAVDDTVPLPEPALWTSSVNRGRMKRHVATSWHDEMREP